MVLVLVPQLLLQLPLLLLSAASHDVMAADLYITTTARTPRCIVKCCWPLSVALRQQVWPFVSPVLCGRGGGDSWRVRREISSKPWKGGVVLKDTFLHQTRRIG